MFVSIMSKIAITSLMLFTAAPGRAQESKEEQLLNILGGFPTPPPLQLDTLESAKLEAGWRYKIEYVAEEADTLFHRPTDKIRAYFLLISFSLTMRGEQYSQPSWLSTRTGPTHIWGNQSPLVWEEMKICSMAWNCLKEAMWSSALTGITTLSEGAFPTPAQPVHR